MFPSEQALWREPQKDTANTGALTLWLGEGTWGKGCCENPEVPGCPDWVGVGGWAGAGAPWRQSAH